MEIRNRGFEIVSHNHRKHPNQLIIPPTRATNKSMGYDLFSTVDATVKPNEIVKIWTDVKAYMQEDECLILNVRSSMGGKFMLANTQGWIDSDYYGNINNDGNIGIFLKNISNEDIDIYVHDRIAQGVFMKYLITDNDEPDKNNQVRIGGFGSSGK